MLKLSRFSIVALLPCKLTNEAVAEPDEQDTGIVGISEVNTITQHVSTAMVSVHQGPRLVHHLTLDYLCNKFTKSLTQW